MKKCSNCGFEFNDSEKFCPSCGMAHKDQTIKEEKKEEKKIYTNDDPSARSSAVNNMYSTRTSRFVTETLAKTKYPFSPSCRKFVYYFSAILLFLMSFTLLISTLNEQSQINSLIQQAAIFNIKLSDAAAYTLHYIRLAFLFISFIYYFYLTKLVLVPYRMNIFVIIISFFFNIIIFAVLLYEYIKYK